jgi:hypothetical protein
MWLFHDHFVFGTSTSDFLTGTLCRSSSEKKKGIDVRLALGVIRSVYRNERDVAVVVGQDQDHSEIADEVRMTHVSKVGGLRLPRLFPISPTSRNDRGIEKTDWGRIERTTYNQCLDPRHHPPRKLR